MTTDRRPAKDRGSGAADKGSDGGADKVPAGITVVDIAVCARVGMAVRAVTNHPHAASAEISPCVPADLMVSRPTFARFR